MWQESSCSAVFQSYASKFDIISFLVSFLTSSAIIPTIPLMLTGFRCNLLVLCFLLRWHLRMLRRRTHCNSSSGPSSFQRMCQRSWSRMSPRSFSSCRWRRAFWVMRFTVHQRQLYCWPLIPFRLSVEITTKRSTDLDTCCLNACYHTGEMDL